MKTLDCWRCGKPGAAERTVPYDGDEDRDLILCHACHTEQVRFRAVLQHNAGMPRGGWYHCGEVLVAVSDARLLELAERLADYWQDRNALHPPVATLAEVAEAVDSSVAELMGYGPVWGYAVEFGLPITWHARPDATDRRATVWLGYDLPTDAPASMRASSDAKWLKTGPAVIAYAMHGEGELMGMID